MRAGIAGAPVGLLADAVLSACGGSDGGGGNAASTSTSDSSPSSSAGSAVSGAAPGTPTTGGTTHGLEMDGPAAEDQKADGIAPGRSSSITVTLRKGTDEPSCPVPGHREPGMQTEITVG